MDDVNNDSIKAKARGVTAYRSNLFADAISEFTDAIHLAESSEAKESIYQVYGNRCAAYQQLNQYEKAIKDAKACTRLQPSWGKGWSHLGRCESQLGRYDKAIAAYHQASTLESDRAKAKEYEKLIQQVKQVRTHLY